MHEKLQTYKYQQYANAYLEVSETVGYACQEEEHGTESEYRKNVREEHYIRVERYGEDGRYAVKSEDKVAKLYEDDSHE